MKTKKLIELLKEEDPSGDEEVLVGNEDIFSLIELRHIGMVVPRY
jgi:hypothetical protein